MKQKIINLLTICKKAGKVFLGSDAVKQGVIDRSVKVILISSDLSQKSEKEIRFFAERNNVSVFAADVTMDDVMNSLGRRSGIIGICDEGFAKRFTALTQM